MSWDSRAACRKKKKPTTKSLFQNTSMYKNWLLFPAIRSNQGIPQDIRLSSGGTAGTKCGGKPSTENASFITAVHVNIFVRFGVFVCLTSLNSSTAYKPVHKRLTDVQVHMRRKKKCTKPITLSQLICFNVGNTAHLRFLHCECFLTLWDPWIPACSLFFHTWNSFWTFRNALSVFFNCLMRPSTLNKHK